MIKKNTLPPEVVKRDNALETRVDKATEELAKLRWHWTLDESNPDRLSIREYARNVARNDKAIIFMVNGYKMWISQGAGRDPHLELIDCIARVRLGEKRAAIHGAVAGIHGVKPSTVRGASRAGAKYAADVKSVTSHVEEYAENHPESTPEDLEYEANNHAQQMATIRKNLAAEAKRHEARQKAAHSRRFLSVTPHLSAMARKLRHVLEEAHEVEFTAEEIELLDDSIGKVRSRLELLQMSITGTSNINWDEELGKLGDMEK